MSPVANIAPPSAPPSESPTLIDALLAEQRSLTAVERFAQAHERHELPAKEKQYRSLLPATAPRPGQQYAFEVDLDKCSGCKSCVTACHSLNGLDETETWRTVGLLVSPVGDDVRSLISIPSSSKRLLTSSPTGIQQHVTTACHHCADPGCANGCPVLAYDKDPVTGIVRHLDDQCMGCSYCVMKCPYEVPKYSARLGIVRKCDMCSQRLAVGEAPACVQACPNEAIKITLVERDEIVTSYRGNGAPSTRSARWSTAATHQAERLLGAPTFLPDSPNPRITLPTTRFVSAKLPADLVAADHAAPRLDHPHWPLVIMLVLTQTAAGIFLAAAIAASAGAPITALTVTGFALLNVGLIASVLHLGQPLKAWRAFLGWRKSWLSREIIAFNGFAVVALLAIVVAAGILPAVEPGFQPGGKDLATTARVETPETLANNHADPAGRMPPSTAAKMPAATLWLAALAGLVAVFTSAMVYVDTRRAFWSPHLVFGNFYGTALLLGATFAAVVFGWQGKFNFAQPFAIAALVIRTTLFVWRRLELRAVLRDSASPIHLNVRAIHELLPWTTPARTQLFVASTVFGLLAIFNVAQLAPVWASGAALTTLSSEIIGRYVFFAASAAKRMPGGFAA
jgi:formate dehydrogenase iron-sulfur subunit